MIHVHRFVLTSQVKPVVLISPWLNTVYKCLVISGIAFAVFVQCNCYRDIVCYYLPFK